MSSSFGDCIVLILETFLILIHLKLLNVITVKSYHLSNMIKLTQYDKFPSYSLYKTHVKLNYRIVIIRLMLSVTIGPKVITLQKRLLCF